MNWFTLIGFLLVLVLCAKYAHATPITPDTAASSIVIKNSSHENHMDNLLYTTSDATVSSVTSNDHSNQPAIVTTTHKPHNERRTQRRRRRPRHRKHSPNHAQSADCRTTTERAPTTTKPTRVYVHFPGIFISQSWGPG